MNTLLLHPSDVLFFRDGRPMGGSLSGHGAAWPLPTVTNAALHAALWRALVDDAILNDKGEPIKVHGHDHHRPKGGVVTDVRKFGSLVTAGPFPVLKSGEWLFPRPLDTGVTEKTEGQPELSSTAVTTQPLEKGFDHAGSSLPAPLKYAAASNLPPTKATPHAWWTRGAWEAYLKGEAMTAEASTGGAKDSGHFHNDSAFSDAESTFGIGIDSDTQTQDGERFYSAHYLRLKPDCRLGVFAEAQDKIKNECTNKRDLIGAIFPNSGSRTPIIVGGQQRACTVERECGQPVCLPQGKAGDFTVGSNGKHLVKWVLLTPAIFPGITAGTSKRGTERKAHPGGWLPTWVCPDTGKVLLQTIDEVERKRRRSLNAAGKGYDSNPNIQATLVAAIVGKAVTVTGYALPHEAAERQQGGAKPTLLAVPAGSVYYFECESAEAAAALASVLNWHGAHAEAGSQETIRNRRSTLMGEKGFGLGVCGTWQFHSGRIPVAKA